MKGALWIISLELAFTAGVCFAIKHITVNKPADTEADDA